MKFSRAGRAGTTEAMLEALEEAAVSLKSPRVVLKDGAKETGASQQGGEPKELLDEEDESMERQEKEAGELQEQNNGSVDLQEQGGSVLRILSTITPWYRLTRRQEKNVRSVELQEQAQEAGSAELQEKETGSEKLLEAGSVELQEQEVGPSKLKEAGSVELQEQGTGSEELQKQRAGSGDLQEEEDTGSARL